MTISAFTKFRYFLEDKGFPEDIAFLMARIVPQERYAYLYTKTLPSEIVDQGFTWARTSWEAPYYHPDADISTDSCDESSDEFWNMVYQCAVELLDEKVDSVDPEIVWKPIIKKIKPNVRILNA